MKNGKFLFVTVYILALIVSVVNVVFAIKNTLFYDINELPEGTMISQTPSPSGERVVTVYLVENSVGSGIRAELSINGGKPKNIFWQTGIDKIDVTWADESAIFFNSVPIDGSGKAPYDCRNGKSLFTDGALETERITPTE